MSKDVAPMVQAPPARPAALSWGPLLEAHPLAHFVYDTSSLRLLAVNEAALVRYGYSRDAFLALTRADLLLPGEVDILRAFLADLPRSAAAWSQRVWLERTRDGRVLHADVRGMPVLFEGRVARLAAVVDAGMRARLQADAGQARDLLVVAGRMAHLGGWSVDLVQRRVRWSDEVCAIHEVPAGTEVDLAAAIAFYPAAAAQTLQAAVADCAARGTPFDLELPIVGARGSQRWVRVAGAAVRDATGAVAAIEGAEQDVTERKLAAIALDDSRTRLGALLGAIPDLWFVIDAEYRYAEVSDPDHPSLSVPWAAKRGRRIDDSREPSHGQTARRLIDAAHHSGLPQSYHYELDLGRGECHSFEGRCVPLSGGRSMLLVRDVTETLQLERRFHSMADAAPIGIFMTDAQGRCTYTNAAWQALYGITFEASLGEGWAACLHPQDRGRVVKRWGEAAAAARPFEMDFRVRTPQGEVRLLGVRSRPIVQADGKVNGHVGAAVDLTQARELEAARQAQAVAEEAGRQQTVFLSRVSHELRTPLNAILGFGQLLQHNREPDEKRARAYATHVVEAGRHMLALVDDLLELQRLEKGRVEVQKTAVDLTGLLSSCADLLRPMADAAAVELVVTVPPGLALRSDERCLRQMALNLGSNAIKYGRAAAGPSRVVMAARATPKGVELIFSDFGPGMTAEQLQRLFQPFERLGQEGGPQPGTGLGLVITRQLVQLLGGDIAIVSEHGRGTTATLQLPA